MGGVGGCGQPLVGGGEEVVQGARAGPAQGAAEFGEGLLFAEKDLGY